MAVRAAETVEGRGRLYARARAREAAVQALRESALQRLRTALDLPADASRPTVVEAVAARTGWPVDHVDAILYGAQPGDDDGMVRLVADLDLLLHASIDVHEGVPR